MPGESSTTAASPARLKRTLTLWDLILYGVIVIQPVAPMSLYGVLMNRGHGHAATTILIAMIAMLLTAFSYGRMARAYPSAGSAFTYVGQEINPGLGYVTGWSMTMDYMLNPMICIIWISQQAHVFAPGVSYGVWAVFFAAVFTALNVQGIKTSARVNSALAAGMGVVIAIFFVAAARYIFGHPHDGAGFFTHPFYDPSTWSSRAVLGGTSVAVLTYIGFDGISTLSEEAENPRRNILRATVLTCVVIGILSAVQVYAAQLIWPITEPFPNSDTAFTFVAGRAWQPLFAIVGFTLVVANFGSGMGAQLGAARLLYGMGRSNALPKKFFGAIDPKRRVPRNNVIFVGVLALAGAFLLPAFARLRYDHGTVVLLSAAAGQTTGYDLGANLLNFGALLAFMGVNAAAFVRYYLRSAQKKIINAIAPLAGFVICAILWWSLSASARIFGGVWMVAGIAYGAIKTRGFKANLVQFEIPADEA